MKKIKYFVLSFILFLSLILDVDASSMSIWANATNVKVGNTVTISVNVSGLGGEFKVTSSDQSILAGGVNSQWLENDTYTFKFTAKKTGKASITVSTIDVGTDDVPSQPYSASKSVTLNVVSASSGGSSNNSSGGGTVADKKEYSKNNNLSSLSIEGYDLEPKFDKDTLEYKIKVDQSVESIKVNAKTEDSKASVSGIGDVNLSLGENTLEVKVTAENGNEKVYKILVSVEDLNPIEVNVNKKKYTIVKKNNDLIELIPNFEEKVITIDEQEVVAYYNKKTKVSLVILKDDANKLGYYIYNEKKNTYEKYRYIKVGSVELQLLNNDKKLKNFKKYNTTIGNEKVDIYKIKKSNKIGLIYGANTSSGSIDYYVYDEKDGTLARYYDEEISIYSEENKKQESIIIGLIGILSLTIIVFMVISLRRNKKKKYKF